MKATEIIYMYEELQKHLEKSGNTFELEDIKAVCDHFGVKKLDEVDDDFLAIIVGVLKPPAAESTAETAEPDNASVATAVAELPTDEHLELLYKIINNYSEELDAGVESSLLRTVTQSNSALQSVTTFKTQLQRGQNITINTGDQSGKLLIFAGTWIAVVTMILSSAIGNGIREHEYQNTIRTLKEQVKPTPNVTEVNR
ncbi:MAG: hypothetical protein ACRDBG_06170 [Waterburya sp.]